MSSFVERMMEETDDGRCTAGRSLLCSSKFWLDSHQGGMPTGRFQVGGVDLDGRSRQKRSYASWARTPATRAEMGPHTRTSPQSGAYAELTEQCPRRKDEILDLLENIPRLPSLLAALRYDHLGLLFPSRLCMLFPWRCQISLIPAGFPTEAVFRICE